MRLSKNNHLTVFVLSSVVSGLLATDDVFAGDEAILVRSERNAARAESRQRQELALAERERRDLTAFGGGKVTGTVRNTVRKRLLGFIGTIEAREMLSRSLSNLPARDFLPNDRLLASLGDDGSLPAPPHAVGSPQAQKWRHQLELHWNAHIDTVLDGSAPDGREIAQMRDFLESWRQAEGTPGDRKRRIALEAYFRTLTQLVDALEETRRVQKLRTRLGGFPGGTVGDLVEWILVEDYSVRPDSRVVDHLRALSSRLLSDVDPEESLRRDSLPADELDKNTTAELRPSPLNDDGPQGENAGNAEELQQPESRRLRSRLASAEANEGKTIRRTRLEADRNPGD
jgi:hypothetical protein